MVRNIPVRSVAAVLAASALTFAACSSAIAGPTVTDAPASGTAKVTRMPTAPIVVPVGTSLAIELAANVGTKASRAGDRLEGRLARDLVVDGRVAAATGARVTGAVTEVVPGSGPNDVMATLVLTFDSIVVHNGATIPIEARYTQQGGVEPGREVASPSTDEIKLRAGTVVRASTSTSFSIY